MTALNKLTKKLGYSFQNSALLERALTHRSFSGINNERLEFLGDAVLNLAIAQELYLKFSKTEEGDLTRFRAALVKGETLAQVAEQFNLGDYLYLGGGELKSGGFRRPSILADALEAIIGAIYLDSNFEQCQQLIRLWFADRIANINHSTEQKDAKTALQEFLQANKFALPSYELQRMGGSDNEPIFYVECRVKGIEYQSTGQGNSRRQAEQMAAKSFLEYLKK
jgi:ribonuclease-3